MIIVVEPTVLKTRFTAFGSAKARTAEWEHARDADEASQVKRLHALVRRLAGAETVEAVAFHLQFGGEFFNAPVKITGDIIATMKKMTAFSPLYIPAVCSRMELLQRELKDIPQFAFSETSLFTELPASEKRYPIATKFFQDSTLMKRGFHGIYHGMHARQFGADGRVISVVMDRYTSVCALQNRIPASVSFGWTPLEGIMSARSCGDVDPGLIVYLMKEYGYSMYRIDDILKKESGFYGMTGLDLPLEKLVRLYGKDGKVTLAFDVYKNQILKYIGDAITVTGGFEKIVFAGKHVLPFRRVITALVKDLAFMGLRFAGFPRGSGSDLFPLTAPHAERQAYVNTLDESDIIYRETLQQLKAN
jgi:acetate kinase